MDWGQDIPDQDPYLLLPLSGACSKAGTGHFHGHSFYLFNSRTTGSQCRLSNPISHRDAKQLTHAVGTCCCSVAQSFLTLCHPMNCSMPASLSITNSRSSLKLTSIKSVMPSSHLILCHPLFLLPPNPSQHQSLFQ